MIARGRAEGLNCFRDTADAVVISFTPGIGLLLAAVVTSLAGAGGGAVLRDIPITLCVLLAPSVLSFELARFWGRDAFWNRYMCAFNWCQWVLPIVGFVLILGLGVARTMGIGGGIGPRSGATCPDPAAASSTPRPSWTPPRCGRSRPPRPRRCP